MQITVTDGCITNEVVIDDNLVVDNYDELGKRMPEIVNAFMKTAGPYAVLLALMEEFGEEESIGTCPTCGSSISVYQIDLETDHDH